MSVQNVTLPRVKNWDEADTVPAPVWWRAADGSILLTCGGPCGLAVPLNGWDIAADGTVSPSIHHADPSCGWHVFVRLLDWDPA